MPRQISGYFFPVYTVEGGQHPLYTRCGEESVSLRHKFRMVSVSASLGDVFGGVGLYSRPGESFAYTAAFGAIPEGFYLCYDTRHEVSSEFHPDGSSYSE